jgi:hypothetical protein
LNHEDGHHGVNDQYPMTNDQEEESRKGAKAQMGKNDLFT